MCNRYVSPDQAEIERFFEIGRNRPLPPWPRELCPRAPGPFVRIDSAGEREAVVGRWGLIPQFAKTPDIRWSTNNARSEELADKPTFRLPWQRGQRCIIPAWTFDEPNWETGRNVWWRFRRADGEPWGLAGIWNRRVRQTGKVHEIYTMFTINADGHPLMGRMHKPDPAPPPDQQDKRSVVPIERGDFANWLTGTIDDARALLRVAPASVFGAGTMGPVANRAAAGRQIEDSKGRLIS